MGRFTLDNAIDLDFFENEVYDTRANDYIIPVMTVLDDIPALAVTEQEAKKLDRTDICLDNDRSIMFLAAAAACGQTAPMTGLAAIGQLPVALVRVEDRFVSPMRVLNL